MNKTLLYKTLLDSEKIEYAKLLNQVGASHNHAVKGFKSSRKIYSPKRLLITGGTSFITNLLRTIYYIETDDLVETTMAVYSFLVNMIHKHGCNTLSVSSFPNLQESIPIETTDSDVVYLELPSKKALKKILIEFMRRRYEIEWD